MNRLLSTTLATVCIAAFSATAAFAQPGPQADQRSASAPMHRFADRPFSRPTERVEARLAYVRTALKITDAQQPQWDAYASFVRKFAQDMEQRFESRRAEAARRAPHERPSAIERLERAQSFHAAAVTRINELLTVEKPLYAALSPQQQKVADVVLNQHSRGMHRPWMHGGGFGRG